MYDQSTEMIFMYAESDLVQVTISVSQQVGAYCDVGKGT